jgi:TRAP-type transport system periplasmic protein
MRTRRYLLTALLGSCSLALAACGSLSPSASDGTYDLKFASYNVPGAAESKASRQWAKEVEEATDGRVTVEFFYQESLLSGEETLPGVADGLADMGYIADAYYPAELALTTVAGVPFVTENPEAQARAFMELYENNEALRQEWESQGVHVVTWAPVPPNIVAVKQPANSIEDMRGRKIRGYGYVSQALRIAGANPIGISQSEVYEGLQRGVLDGTSGASLDIAADRDYQEVAPHFVDINYGNYAITANVINRQSWESMPQNIRNAINRVSEDYLETYLAELNKLEAAACDELLQAGGDVTILDEADTAAWRERAGSQIRQIWADDVTSSKPDVDPDAFYGAYTSALERHEARSDYQSAMKRCAEQQ